MISYVAISSSPFTLSASGRINFILEFLNARTIKWNGLYVLSTDPTTFLNRVAFLLDLSNTNLFIPNYNIFQSDLGKIKYSSLQLKFYKHSHMILVPANYPVVNILNGYDKFIEFKDNQMRFVIVNRTNEQQSNLTFYLYFLLDIDVISLEGAEVKIASDKEVQKAGDAGKFDVVISSITGDEINV